MGFLFGGGSRPEYQQQQYYGYGSQQYPTQTIPQQGYEGLVQHPSYVHPSFQQGNMPYPQQYMNQGFADPMANPYNQMINEFQQPYWNYQQYHQSQVHPQHYYPTTSFVPMSQPFVYDPTTDLYREVKDNTQEP
jgi:hypothetical protein